MRMNPVENDEEYSSKMGFDLSMRRKKNQRWYLYFRIEKSDCRMNISLEKDLIPTGSSILSWIIIYRDFSSRKIAFLIAWIVFVVLIYRTTLIEIEHKDYDPFVVLNVDPVNIRFE